MVISCHKQEIRKNMITCLCSPYSQNPIKRDPWYPNIQLILTHQIINFTLRISECNATETQSIFALLRPFHAIVNMGSKGPALKDSRLKVPCPILRLIKVDSKNKWMCKPHCAPAFNKWQIAICRFLMLSYRHQLMLLKWPNFFHYSWFYF